MTDKEWKYCPECGSEQTHCEEGKHKECTICYQEWWSDCDYSDVVKINLAKRNIQNDRQAKMIVRLTDLLKAAVVVLEEEGYHRHAKRFETELGEDQ